MKSKTTIAVLAVLALPHFAFGDEEDKPVKFEELPAAVATAIKGAAGEAKLDTIVLGDEDGKLLERETPDAKKVPKKDKGEKGKN